MKVSRDEFRGLPPRGHIDEVSLRLFSVLCTVAAVDSDREGSYRYAGRRGFQFRIGCEPTAQNDLIEVYGFNEDKLKSISDYNKSIIKDY